jgi:YkoY family integral membrane protein
MVKDLPKNQQNKALHYGIVGAYLFRGIALLFAGALLQFWWVKPIGGLYLLYLTFKYFKGLGTEKEDDDVNKDNHPFYKFLNRIGLTTFVATILMVEVMDIAFSIDNIFAVVAFSKNQVLIIFGVMIGILAMRYVANRFVKLMEAYPFLETCAFIVIGILGFKLCLAALVHYFPELHWIESEAFDLIISALTLVTFFAPIAYHKWLKKPATA